jgi:peroxiredoxin (alkyl hydroperoxide reductase subunit C)
MKNNFLTLILIVFTLGFVQAQKVNNSAPLHIGSDAPSFVAQSTQGQIKFPDDYYGKWKIIFSHPADFTPVCTSEIMGLAAIQDEFKKLNTALFVVSTDGLNSHIEWIKSMESINSNGLGPVTIKFPIIADLGYDVSRKYGMLRADTLDRRDIRTVFFINPENKIQAMFYYPDFVGRNVEEIKRTLIALQTHEKSDVLLPANWKPGDDVLIHSPQTMSDADKLKAKGDPNLRMVTWYMWFRKM